MSYMSSIFENEMNKRIPLCICLAFKGILKISPEGYLSKKDALIKLKKRNNQINPKYSKC